MKTRTLITAALTTLCLAAPAAASAATRYAEPSGDGAFPCLQTDPCDVQLAVEGQFTQNGDEIVLLPGTYELGSNELDITKALDVHGQAGQTLPVLNASSVYGVFSNNAGAKLSRVRIEHTGTGAAFNFILGTVDRVFAHTTINTASGTACTGQGIVIRNTVCWGQGDHMAGVGANQSGGNWTMKLRNVTAIGTGNQSNAAGIRLYSSTNANHTIVGKGVIADSPGGDILTLTDASSSSTITLDHSNYSNSFSFGPGTRSITPAGSGTNQTATPTFVDAAAGDFREAPDSPTIDMGELDADSGSLDLADAPRTDGMGPDIGAYELATTDDDSDGVADTADNCQFAANTDQSDVDGDGIGDVCDPTDDRPVTPPEDTTPPGDATPPGDTTPPDVVPDEPADRAAPDTVIDRAPANGTHKRRARVAFHSTEAGSTFECSLDRGAYAPCASPLRMRVKGGRKHRLEIRAVDAAGNADPTPAVVRWRVLAR